MHTLLGGRDSPSLSSQAPSSPWKRAAAVASLRAGEAGSEPSRLLEVSCMAQLKKHWEGSCPLITAPPLLHRPPHSSHRNSVAPGGKASPFLSLFETNMSCSADHVVSQRLSNARVSYQSRKDSKAECERQERPCTSRGLLGEAASEQTGVLWTRSVSSGMHRQG